MTLNISDVHSASHCVSTLITHVAVEVTVICNSFDAHGLLSTSPHFFLQVNKKRFLILPSTVPIRFEMHLSVGLALMCLFATLQLINCAM